MFKAKRTAEREIHPPPIDLADFDGLVRTDATSGRTRGGVSWSLQFS